MTGLATGKLDRRVSFARAVLVDDGFQEVEEWGPHGSPVAASKTDVSDGERMRAGEVSATLTSRFIVRSSAFSRDLTPKDRIVYDGATFEIFGIKEIARKSALEITAGRRVDQ